MVYVLCLQVRALVRPMFLRSKLHMFIYDVVTWFATTMLVSTCACCFLILRWQLCVNFLYHNQLFLVHACLLALAGAFFFLPPPRTPTRPSRSNQTIDANGHSHRE